MKIDVPQSSLALQSVFEFSSRSAENGWDVGWSLASSSNAVQNPTDAYSMVLFPFLFLSIILYVSRKMQITRTLKSNSIMLYHYRWSMGYSVDVSWAILALGLSS